MAFFLFSWVKYLDKYLQDTPLLTWTKFRAEYLDICLILEGRGRFYESCGNPQCRSELPFVSPSFRCLDCFGYALLCKECIVSVHHINPLHRIQVINHQYRICRKLNLNART